MLAGFSGFAIERTGFIWFFVGTSLIGLPVALLAVFVWYRVGISDEAPIQVAGDTKAFASEADASDALYDRVRNRRMSSIVCC